jgi:vacuolar protein sorting-associated protein 13A/C
MKASFHNLFYSIDSVNSFVANKKNQKIFFDYCHISPIKTHLSFSLSGADAFKGQNIFLDNPLFKSIGLVLTDMQDVVFK